MKHVRGDLMALLAVVALTLVGQREAAAAPCKADGQTCRTSRSCCGTSGNNGVCVGGGAKVGFGVCCTPTTCTPLDCGQTPNACGGLLLCPCTPPACGNAILEAGEECDGQPFCTPDCHIQAGYCCDGLSGGPVCADLGTILDSACFFACVQSGGQCSFGTCVGTACTDVPYPPTAMCCDGTSGCSSTVVSGSASLAQFVHDCGYVHSLLNVTVGTCGPDDHCIPGN